MMPRYLRLWGHWARLSLRRESLFRGNAWVRLLTQALWLGTAWVFFAALYLHVPTIAGWRREQVWLLIAVNELAQGVYNLFVGRGILRIPNLIEQGELDRILIQPVAPLFTLSVSRMRLYDAPSLALPLALGAYALHALGQDPSLPQWLWFGVLLLLGIAARYAVTLAVVSTAFWVTRVYALPALLAELFRLAGYPEGIFRGLGRALFTWAVPVLVVANFPTQVLLGAPPLFQCATALLVAGLWLAAALALWRAGLRRYTAVGG